MVLHVHKAKTDNLDLNGVANTLLTVNTDLSYLVNFVNQTLYN